MEEYLALLRNASIFADNDQPVPDELAKKVFIELKKLDIVLAQDVYYGLAGSGGESVSVIVQNQASGEYAVIKMALDCFYKVKKDTKVYSQKLDDWEFDGSEKDMKLRFLRGATIQQALAEVPEIRPHIPTVYHISENPLYIKMSYIRGTSPLAWFHGRSFSQRAYVFNRLLLIFQAIHARGIVHRDIKEANIIVSGGEPIVIDWTVCKSLKAEIRNKNVTRIGETIGSAEYIDPAVIDKAKIANLGTDIFSLGILMALFVTGSRPLVLDGENLLDVKTKETYKRRIYESLPTLDFKQVFTRATGKARFASCSEFSQAFLDACAKIGVVPTKATGDVGGQENEKVNVDAVDVEFDEFDCATCELRNEICAKLILCKLFKDVL